MILDDLLYGADPGEVRVVFLAGADPRSLQAAALLLVRGSAVPTLIGAIKDIAAVAARCEITLPEAHLAASADSLDLAEMPTVLVAPSSVLQCRPGGACLILTATEEVVACVRDDEEDGRELLSSITDGHAQLLKCAGSNRPCQLLRRFGHATVYGPLLDIEGASVVLVDDGTSVEEIVGGVAILARHAVSRHHGGSSPEDRP